MTERRYPDQDRRPARWLSKAQSSRCCGDPGVARSGSQSKVAKSLMTYGKVIPVSANCGFADQRVPEALRMSDAT
jgi:hypothetical protein